MSRHGGDISSSHHPAGRSLEGEGALVGGKYNAMERLQYDVNIMNIGRDATGRGTRRAGGRRWCIVFQSVPAVPAPIFSDRGEAPQSRRQPLLPISRRNCIRTPIFREVNMATFMQWNKTTTEDDPFTRSVYRDKIEFEKRRKQVLLFAKHYLAEVFDFLSANLSPAGQLNSDAEGKASEEDLSKKRTVNVAAQTDRWWMVVANAGAMDRQRPNLGSHEIKSRDIGETPEAGCLIM